MLIFRNLFFLFLLFTFYPVQAQLPNQIVPISRHIVGEVSGGSIFITPSTLDSVDTYPSALCILDSIGRPVFYKAETEQASGPYSPSRISDFKLQPSGLMSFSSQMEIGGMGMYLLDSSFNIIDSIKCVNGVLTDGHDFLHFSDGFYHIVGTEERIMDLSTMFTSNGIPGEKDASVIGNVIQRFDSEKNLIFEWKSLDHFELNDVFSHYFTRPDALDHSHYNSLELDNDGHYIISFRHLHEITKINSSSGQIIWRFGGKNNQFELLGDTMLFTAQHDARRISNGNLTLFDNASHSSIPVARAIEYHLDEENLTATAVWQFKEPNGFRSTFIGNANRLPNGNTLVDWGGAFPLSQSTSFTEVDSEGNIIMELDFIPNRYVSYRSVKHYLPFIIDRPEIECDEQDRILSGPYGYSSYQWNTGATTQSITVQDTGIYQVWVEKGIGFVSSVELYVSDLNNICGSTHVEDLIHFKTCIYPNPAFNTLFIDYPGSQIIHVQVYRITGQLVEEFELNFDRNTGPKSIDVRHLPAGLYLLKIDGTSVKFLKN